MKSAEALQEAWKRSIKASGAGDFPIKFTYGGKEPIVKPQREVTGKPNPLAAAIATSLKASNTGW